MAKVALFAALVVSSTASIAQSIPQGEDVANRAHPEYEEVGVDAGGFTLKPSITSTIAATDNYRASNENREANVRLLLRPDLTWESKWGRHRLNGDTFLEQTLNVPHNRENATSYGISSAGEYDFSADTDFELRGSARHLVEDPRSLNSFHGSIDPVQYNVFSVAGTLSQILGPVELQGTLSADKFDYLDAVLPGGTKVSQDYRDVHVLTIAGSAQYNLDSGIGIVVTGRHYNSHYDFGPGSAGFFQGFTLDRDSTSDTVQAGISLELSNLLFGTIQAGYLHRDYDDPRFNDVAGPTFTADLLWDATPLTSFVVTGRRWVEESSSLVSAGNIRTDFNLAVHHELYRQLLLTAATDVSKFTPVSAGSSGYDYGITLGGRYLMSRRATLSANLRYSRRDTDNLFIRYRATEATVSFRYGL